jgi:hypothetical protein
MYTVSLEIAKTLKDAGWNIHTEFVYCKGSYVKGETHHLERWEGEWPLSLGFHAAPHLGELIRELPDDYSVSKDGRIFWRNNNLFPVEVENPIEDACALAWIALKEAKPGYDLISNQKEGVIRITGRNSMGISKKQKEVLEKMKPEQWYCAYDLRCSLATLDALKRRGLVEAKSGLGAGFSPRTEIKWKIKI